ncbi:hypothetical protein SOX05_08680 [Pseudomonas putida]|nr:hypothetical protein [Pseudomonas putida]MDY4319336.1 hypothetical protein [Pseudomonas putida]MDY4352721.1 hypothetical protein [Pseudomonas putida]
MIRIENRYTELKDIIECFEIIEQDIIETIKIALLSNAVVIKKRILDRLKAVDPTLEHQHLYTFKSRMNEIFEVDHPIRGVVPSLILDGMSKIKNDIVGDYKLITTLSFKEINDTIESGEYDEYEMSYIQKPLMFGVVNGYPTSQQEKQCASIVFGNTQNHITDKKINLSTLEIYKHYLSVVKMSDTKTKNIGKAYAKDIYTTNLNIAVNTIINTCDDFSPLDFNLSHGIVGNLIQIAEMNSSELGLFATSHYTRIPFVKDYTHIEAAVEKRTDDTSTLYLKGEKGITELSFCYYRSSLGYFELNHYPYDGSNICLAGYDFELTPDIFTGESLDLFNMAFFDSTNISLFQNIQVDYVALRKRGQAPKASEYELEILYYLQDRAGLCERRDNKRLN